MLGAHLLRTGRSCLARGSPRCVGSGVLDTHIAAIATSTRKGGPSPLSSSSLSSRHYSAVTTPTVSGLVAGDELHGYRVERVTPVEEFRLTAVELEHTATGARHIHLARDDSDNVFAVLLRTLPQDSTGVAHILEHTTLCGSRRFPCRDPFFKMLTRSLATYMNALTGSDFTMYPFSTTNARDFENLMGVYLDAVFFPLLSESDFRQEGWRLEHEDPGDADTPVIFKGVVFNEMKGVFSAPDSVFCQQAQQLIHPETTYGHCSGGLPLDILNLTHEDLIAFHQRYYHPSNATFLTYGDMPLEPTLAGISERALQHFEASERLPISSETPRWSEPRRAAITCAPDVFGDSQQTTMSLSWLLGSTANTFDAFLLRIVCDLLSSGTDSPLYKALIDSGLGTDYSPNTGYDGSTQDAVFAVGLQGLTAEQVDEVEARVLACLTEVAETGFDKGRVEALLHQVEMGTRRQTSKFGLNLAIQILTGTNHGARVDNMIQVGALAADMRARLDSDPNILSDTVRTYFLDNTHRLTLEMTPDPSYQRAEEDREQAILDKALDVLSPDGYKDLRDAGLALQAAQSQPSPVQCLPTLGMDDIAREGISYVPNLRGGGGSNGSSSSSSDATLEVEVFTCDQPTNGLSYFRTSLDARQLPADTTPLLPLFCSVWTSVGAGDRGVEEFAQAVKRRTGGVSAMPYLICDHSDADRFQHSIMLSSSCLDRNVDSMFQLWEDMLSSPRWHDVHHIGNTLRMMSADVVNHIAHSGHVLALEHAASLLTVMGEKVEAQSGLAQIQTLRALADSADPAELGVRFEGIARALLAEPAMRVMLTADGTPALEALEARLDTFLAKTLPTNGEALRPFASFSDEIQGKQPPLVGQSTITNTFVPMPFGVNYVGRCVPGVPYTHPDFASLEILLKLLSSKFLHREIREKGGAYGGGAGIGSCLVHFYSYRDPRSLATLDAFDAAGEWAAEGKFDDNDISEAKLAIFQDVDAPQSPGSRGLSYFKGGVTPEMRQAHRTRLLAVTRSDLEQAAAQYLVQPLRSATTIIGYDGDTDQYLQADGWTVRPMATDDSGQRQL